MKVFFLPFAGAGAALYRSWQAPDGITIAPLQLAGREERFGEDPYATLDDAIDDQIGLIKSQLDNSPYCLFGHSFGAILAFEIAHRMVVQGGPVPTHLFVSGSTAPDVSLGRHSRALSDMQFIAQVEKIAGYSHPALADPDLRELVLPTLRADVAMHEDYLATERQPLPIQITVLRGTEDQIVSEVDCENWQRWSLQTIRVRQFSGGHMYLLDANRTLLAEMAGTVKNSCVMDCSA